MGGRESLVDKKDKNKQGIVSHSARGECDTENNKWGERSAGKERKPAKRELLLPLKGRNRREGGKKQLHHRRKNIPTQKFLRIKVKWSTTLLLNKAERIAALQPSEPRERRRKEEEEGRPFDSPHYYKAAQSSITNRKKNTTGNLLGKQALVGTRVPSPFQSEVQMLKEKKKQRRNAERVGAL